jgi:hypothetical protein
MPTTKKFEYPHFEKKKGSYVRFDRKKMAGLSDDLRYRLRGTARMLLLVDLDAEMDAKMDLKDLTLLVNFGWDVHGLARVDFSKEEEHMKELEDHYYLYNMEISIFCNTYTYRSYYEILAKLQLEYSCKNKS